MVNDAMKSDKFIGMIQPKSSKNNDKFNLHDVGCLGKITRFEETNDGHYMIDLKGLIRFKIVQKVKLNIFDCTIGGVCRALKSLDF